MKKIIIRKFIIDGEENRWEISNVQTEDFYKSKGKSIDDIIDAANKQNDLNNGIHWDIIDVDDNVYEAFCFVLGDKQYESLVEMRDIRDRLDDIKSAFDTIESDISDWSYTIETSINKFDKLIEK